MIVNFLISNNGCRNSLVNYLILFAADALFGEVSGPVTYFFHGGLADASHPRRGAQSLQMLIRSGPRLLGNYGEVHLNRLLIRLEDETMSSCQHTSSI